MAYLIRCREVGVAEAVGLLDPTRHRPNRLVVSLGEGVLDGPDVLAAFDEWRVRHAGVRLVRRLDNRRRRPTPRHAPH